MTQATTHVDVSKIGRSPYIAVTDLEPVGGDHRECSPDIRRRKVHFPTPHLSARAGIAQPWPHRTVSDISNIHMFWTEFPADLDADRDSRKKASCRTRTRRTRRSMKRVETITEAMTALDDRERSSTANVPSGSDNKTP